MNFLWKMMIEQYFLMTDYSLWEVILNGDSSTPTRVIECVVQPVAPTTAEQRLARKNKLKARGTLLMALLDKYQLKFNIHKDSKTLMEAIEKRFGGNKETKKDHTLIWRNKTDLGEQSLDDLFNSLKIYEVEVKSSSSASTSTQNIAFVSSQTTDITNNLFSDVASVSAASAKIPVSALPNMDTLNVDDLEEIDLKWQMVMLTVRARRFLQRTGRNLRENGLTSMGFDMSKVECYNCHRKGHFVREYMSPKDTRRNGAAKSQRRNVPVETSTSNAFVSQCDDVGSYDWSFQAEEEPTNYALMAFTSSSSSSSDTELTDDFRKSQFDVISYKTGLESVEARLLVYQQNETVFEEDIKLLNLEVQLRDNALEVLRQNLKKVEQERDDLKLKLEKFQTSSKNLSQLLASQTNDKTRLGYNTQVFTSFMFDCDEMFTSESDNNFPVSPIYDRYHSGDGYHAIPPPYTGTFMPPKPDLVFHDAPNVTEINHNAFNVELRPSKPEKDLSHTHRPSAPIIEDWVSDSEDNSEAKIPQNALSFIQPIKQVKTPRPSVKTVETSIPTANTKTAIPKPKRNDNRRNRKACFVCKSLDHLIKDLLTKSKLVLITTAKPVTAVVPKPHVTRPRQAKTVVTKPHTPPRRIINRSPSSQASTFSPKVTAAKAPMVNVVKGVQGKWEWKPKCPILDHGNPLQALKDKGVIDSGCSRHMTGNISYLSDFEELNGGYVAIGGNLNGGKISGKDENQVLLRVPRENNMYNVDLKNIIPSQDLTCLFAKATLDESNLWHKRLGHINFKTMNKLVKGNLVRGLPTKVFENDHTCVACKKGKQHRASCKTKPGIKRKFSVPRTPQQNGIAERKNRTLIKAARTMLADSLLPIPFWAEAVNTACYVQNRVLVTKPQNTTPYELLLGRTPSIGFMKPFSCPVTIFNTLDPLGKFDEKVDERFLVGYSASSKSFRNTDDDAAFRGKEPEFEGRKPESEVHVSPSSKFEDFSDNSINEVNAADSLVPDVGQIFTNNTNTFSVADPSNAVVKLEDITYSDDKEDVGAEADFTNLETSIIVIPIPTTRVHKDHHEELLQFKMQKVWVLVDLPNVKRAIGHTQEEGIDYEEVFAPVPRIEAIRLFLAYASFMGFMVYQMDVKSAFLYRTIEEEVYVCQPLGFEDLDYLDKIYVDDIIFGSTNKDLCKAFKKFIKNKFQMSSMGELTLFLGLQVKQKEDGIFISQDKYVVEILRKFCLIDRKSASTPIDTKKPLLKDLDGEDVDVYTYRSMIGSLMYLTSSRPDIMFAVCACARFQVTPKSLHLHAVKRIFRYLKGKPHLGLWYPKDSPFNLVAYSDSDYAGASLDRKSTTWGCQFFGCRLISWQCKKQTVVATSSIEAKYVAVASCCAQVLWI
nr:putative ribonuclease H-like domain-containing protein [Tanacetum cinerariifolium]